MEYKGYILNRTPLSFNFPQTDNCKFLRTKLTLKQHLYIYDPLTPTNFGSIHSNGSEHGAIEAQTDAVIISPLHAWIYPAHERTSLYLFTLVKRYSEVDPTTNVRTTHEIQQFGSKPLRS